jgi:hypothetical protein
MVDRPAKPGCDLLIARQGGHQTRSNRVEEEAQGLLARTPDV